MTDATAASEIGVLDAAILCGGLGTRLRAAVPDLPKALAPVGGRPFLEILLAHLAASRLRRFVLCAGHRADELMAAAPGLCHSGEIVISRETAPLGTGGALRHALPLLRGDRFFALNGDSLCPIDLGRLLAFHRARRARVSVGLAPAERSSEGGVVRLGLDERIEAFDEKGSVRAGAFTNVGVYVIEREVFDSPSWPAAFSLEHDVFPALVGRGLYGFAQADGFVDIGTPERWRGAGAALAALTGDGVATHESAEPT